MNARHTILLASTLLGAASARAQEAPASRPAGAAQAWVTTVKGKPVGSEAATTKVADGLLTLTTQGKLGPRSFSSTLTVKADDLSFVRNRLTVPGAKITAVAAPDGVAVKIEAPGQNLDQTVKGQAPFLVLENMVFSSYELLTRYAVKHSPEKPLAFTLVVPTKMVGAKATFAPGKTFQTTWNGEPVTARWARLAVASLDLEVAYDPQGGRCYGVRIRSQQIAGFRKGFKLPALAKLPAPKLAAGAREVDVSVENPLPGSLKALPGTLTLPAGKGPFPVAVLVQGSGAHDRDETIGPNKPFRDLAYALAAQGIASLRYDKRNWRENKDRVIPPERWKTTLREESILDAVAALKLCAARDDLGPRFLIGHSLGALAAPYVAQQRPELAGIVLMAGPGRPFDVLLREQQTYQLGLLGLPPEEVKKKVDDLLAPVAKIRAGELKGKTRSLLGASAHYWADMLKRDAPAVLKGLKLPVLLLQGAKDCQVSVKDYEALLAALKTRPATTTHEAKVFPDLNHLFMKVEGRSTGAEYGIEGRVAPEVLKALTAWIQKTSEGKGKKN